MQKAILVLVLSVSFSCWAQEKPAATPATSNNPELEKIYNDDQGERTGALKLGPGVMERDRERRKQVAALIDAGKLQTGDDYFHAAMVYQHGELPDDYLRAHELAILAAASGNKTALWLSAATLDRYLQKIGKPQVFGTQYNWKQGEPWTMDPYDRSFYSDAFRAQFNVPPLAKQEEQLTKMNQKQ